ncbi:Cell wall-binding protein YocH precursor [compost metagenome]
MKKHPRITRTIRAAVIAVGLAGLLQTVPVHADSVHKAKEGDTFYTLSKQYSVNLDKLINANPAVEASNIYEGLNITIPGASSSNGVVTTASAQANSTGSAAILPTLNVFSSDNVVEAWGKTFNYSKTVSVKATAYSAAASENGKWGAVDYFGNPLELGTIAVDPSVIPMGTKVLVTGHSHDNLPKNAFVATATDQGGAIKGHRIDIFIPGSAKNVSSFGFQDVTLYILK